MSTLLQDLRYAARMFARNPGFAVVAIVALALGIGVNTALFSVVNTVLLKPAPFGEPDELVMVFDSNPKRGWERFAVSPPNFLDYRAQNQVFESIFAFNRGPFALTGRGDAERVYGVLATPPFMKTMQVAPLLGRDFLPEEGEPGKDKVVILGHGMWQRKFSGDPNIVGQTVRLDNQEYTVIGVAPPRFTLAGGDLFVPLSFGPEIGKQRGAHYLRIMARLKPGMTLEQADQNIKLIASQLQQSYPNSNTNWTARVDSLYEMSVGSVRPALLMLLGAVALVALIACANVANLLLARATGRTRELAVRAALGAPRGRIIRQVLTESLVLALAAGASAMLFAYWALELLVKIGPPDIPRLSQVSIDARVLLFTLGLSLGTGILFGLLPAMRSSRVAAHQALQSGSRTVSAARETRHLRSGLVVAEIAISLLLMVGAGLLLRSFTRLLSVDPGFDPQNVLTFDISLPQAKYDNAVKTHAFFDRLVRDLQAQPGVEHAGIIFGLPLASGDWSSSFDVEGWPEARPDEGRSAELRVASPGYFPAMRIPLINGRLFTDTDGPQSPPVILINQAAVRKFFTNEDPVGRFITFGASMGYARLKGTIVGVVGDVRDQTLEQNALPAFYAAASQAGAAESAVVLRTSIDPSALAAPVRAAVAAIDPEVPLAELATMEDVLANSVGRRRFFMTLLGTFAALALVLAAVGIYGVMAYSVTQRTQEIGVRMALGANRGQILGMVLGQSAVLVGLGTAAGLAAAFLLTRVLQSMLVEVSPRDPLAFAAGTLVLGAVALLASFIPARRATAVDPAIALRYEVIASRCSRRRMGKAISMIALPRARYAHSGTCPLTWCAAT